MEGCVFSTFPTGAHECFPCFLVPWNIFILHTFRSREVLINIQLFLLYTTWKQLKLLLSIRYYLTFKCSHWVLKLTYSITCICKLFLQNSSEVLYYLFERYYDHFHATSRNSLHANFISSHSNNIHALDQLCILKIKANSFSQVSLFSGWVIAS